MLLRVPETIENVIWEGALEEETEDTGIKFAHPPTNRAEELPIVSIGRPEKWNMTDLYAPNPIPSIIQTKLNEANFYLVQLSCSFRPIKDELEISQAFFTVELLPDRDRHQPIAFNLHPLEVNQEIERNCTFTLSPSLKFVKIEGSLGSAEFGLAYSELQPMIIATGVGEPTPRWEYQKTNGKAVHGSKFMYLLLKTPQAMQQVRARIKLTAELKKPGITRKFNFWNKTDNEATDYLSVQLV